MGSLRAGWAEQQQQAASSSSGGLGEGRARRARRGGRNGLGQRREERKRVKEEGEDQCTKWRRATTRNKQLLFHTMHAGKWAGPRQIHASTR